MLNFVWERDGEEDGVEGPLRPSELTQEGEGNLHTCSGTYPNPKTLPFVPAASAEQAGDGLLGWLLEGRGIFH